MRVTYAGKGCLEDHLHGAARNYSVCNKKVVTILAGIQKIPAPLCLYLILYRQVCFALDVGALLPIRHKPSVEWP